MFKAIRIAILLFVLLFVSLSTWLTSARSTDWNNSLWLKIYPINADGSEASSREIARLKTEHFIDVEEFVAREAGRYGKTLARPVRIELGSEILSQPPQIAGNANFLDILLWSLRMRWWVGDVADDKIAPDVRIFLRYHGPDRDMPLENSVGIKKGMFGIVNAYASREHRGTNNVIIAHEFLHTLGASDKYDPATGLPVPPDGLAQPDLRPLYPQSRAEIMGGRISLAEDDAMIPQSLRFAVIGQKTAEEIRLSP
jgi:hypothetical protein